MWDLTYRVLNVLKEAEKKKRGEHGSTQEDTSTWAKKKANMAASGMNTGIEEAIQMLSEETLKKAKRNQVFLR